MIRRTFRGPAESRGDQSVQVRWSSEDNSVLTQQEALDNCRNHFASVGDSNSFDEYFLADVSARFRAIHSACEEDVGRFDAPFSASELRHALTLCVDSAVGLDGLPYSIFKPNYPWWQHAILTFLNLVFSWGVVPSLWKRSIVVPIFKRGDPSLPHNYRPISLASCFFKNARALGPLSQKLLSLCLNWMNPNVVSAGVLMFWSTPWSPSCFLVLPTRSSLLSTSREHWTRHGLRGRWSDCLMLVCGAACGTSCAISCKILNPMSVPVPPSQVIGNTLALLKAVSFHLFFSTWCPIFLVFSTCSKAIVC